MAYFVPLRAPGEFTLQARCLGPSLPFSGSSGTREVHVRLSATRRAVAAPLVYIHCALEVSFSFRASHWALQRMGSVAFSSHSQIAPLTQKLHTWHAMFCMEQHACAPPQNTRAHQPSRRAENGRASVVVTRAPVSNGGGTRQSDHLQQTNCSRIFSERCRARTGDPQRHCSHAWLAQLRDDLLALAWRSELDEYEPDLSETIVSITDRGVGGTSWVVPAASARSAETPLPGHHAFLAPLLVAPATFRYDLALAAGGESCGKFSSRNKIRTLVIIFFLPSRLLLLSLSLICPSCRTIYVHFERMRAHELQVSSSQQRCSVSLRTSLSS